MSVSIRDVTPDDASALAHVLINAEKHAFQGLVPDKCLEFTESESATNWRKFFAKGIPNVDKFIVAETNNNVVGYAWGKPRTDVDDYAGELYQIMILPEYQGQGIGRRLLCEIAHYLAENNVRNMCVKVLRMNPNWAFYENMGAEFISDYLHNWDGTQFIGYVYGWENIAILLKNCKQRNSLDSPV